MTEILTESFCERCGTRYTFESGAPGKSVFGGVRVAAKGLRMFAFARHGTFAEAMADARGQEMVSATAQQLDAFHSAFIFCLGCRQYTCHDCWNVDAGKCRTCVPLPDDLAASVRARREAALAAAEASAVVRIAPRAPAPEPPADAERAAAAAPDETVPPAPAETVPPAPEPVTPPAPAPAPESLAYDRHAIAGLPPGESLEDAVARYEALLAEREATAPAASPAPSTPLVAFPIAPAGRRGSRRSGDAASKAPAPQASEAAPTPEPSLAPPPPAAPAFDPPPPPAPPSAVPSVIVSVVAQTTSVPMPPPPPAMAPMQPAPEPAVLEPPVLEPPALEPAELLPASTDDPDAWHVVAPETAPMSPSDTADQPRWPVARPWPRTRRDPEPAPVDEAPLPASAVAAMWAASAQQVLGAEAASPAASVAEPDTARVERPSNRDAAPGATHACDRCGLALSATARFCRRCGMPQP